MVMVWQKNRLKLRFVSTKSTSETIAVVFKKRLNSSTP